jgi:hypothetical protein
MGTLQTIWGKQLLECTSLEILKTLIVKRLYKKKHVGTKDLVRERSKTQNSTKASSVLY